MDLYFKKLFKKIHMEIELSIIIVNYKTPSLVINCLKSIYENTKCLNIEIIIVDNYSNDNSKELIINLYPEVIWLQNDKNEGFGHANNNGAKVAKGEIIFFLNSDTIILNNAIDRLYEMFVNESRDIGMVSCQLLNKDMTKQKSKYYFNASFYEILNYNLFFNKLINIFNLKIKKENISALSGACLMTRSDYLSEVGGFDENFFMYSEEFNLCYRFIKKGYKLKVYDKINIIHYGEESSRDTNWNIKQRNVSTVLLFYKKYGFFGTVLMLLIRLLNTMMNFFIWPFIGVKFWVSFIRKQLVLFPLIPFYIKIITNYYNKKTNKLLKIRK